MKPTPSRNLDLFYRLTRGLGYFVGGVATRPTVLHAEQGKLQGGWLLASNHACPMDVPCLIYTTRRRLDFVSIIELMRHPLVGAIFRGLNCVCLDRGRVDAKAVRQIVDKLERGRVVALFPEGRVMSGEDSVIHGGPHRKGFGKIAVLAGVPVVPCVVLGTGVMTRWQAWLPGARSRWKTAYGSPIIPPAEMDKDEAAAWIESQWRDAVVRLKAELDAPD